MSGEYGGRIRTSQTSCNSFCLVIKETCGLVLSWWKIMHFLLTNSGHFSSSAAFSWSNGSGGFPEGVHNRGLPSNLTVYTTSLSLVEDRPLVWLVVVHFTCPTISSIPHYCTVSTFHHPSQFVSKTIFSLRLSRESRVEIRSRRFFSLMSTQTSKRLT